MRSIHYFYLILWLLPTSIYAQHSFQEGVKLLGESSESTVKLYLTIELETAKDELSNYRFKFVTSDDKQGSTPLIYLDSTYLGSRGSEYFIRFDFSRKKLDDLIRVTVFNTTTAKEQNLDFEITESHPFIVTDLDGMPIVNYWSNPQEFSLTSYPAKCFYYSYDFTTGLPPMSTRDQPLAKALEVDSTFEISEKFMLTKPGLYLFQKDSSSTAAVTLRIEELYYPKFASLSNLVKPLKYITTKDERRKLDSIGDSKQQFDQFWLGVGQNQERAITIIRTFYNRVEYANRNFTTFKEGWKTDKGLIYLVMGKPDFIENIGNREVWTYSQNRYLPKRVYQFLKTTTIFSPAHYVLIREKKHGSPWFEGIDLLRKGVF